MPDLDDLIAVVDRTCTTAHSAGRDQPDWLELLKTAAEVAARLHVLADELIEEYIEHARMHGCSWADIGETLGVTRQAMQQRFQSPQRQYAPEEFADETRAAMRAMKETAVRNRNNFIGTEHLLAGLLAQDNSATALLTTRGVAVDHVRRLLDEHLTIGASQAAARIAWTPYARRAMAYAKETASDTDTGVIRCEHLLGGLVRLGRGIAASVLTEAGVDPAALASGRPLTPLSRRAAAGQLRP